MLLACADFLSDRAALGRYSEFVTIAQNQGMQIEFETLEGAVAGGSDKEFVARWTALIERADAYWIRTYNFPHDDGEPYLKRVLGNIRAGRSALVQVSVNHLDIVNTILAPFEMVAADLRVFVRRCERGDASAVHFRRDDGCFRHLDLFAGIEDVVVGQPNVVWHSGHAMPLLSSSDDHVVIDQGDLPAKWQARECSCITGWVGDAGQTVVAIAGSLLGDPYRGLLGDQFPVIAANRRFAENLVRWLTRTAQNRSKSGAMDGNNLCDRIEEHLMDIVLAVLRHKHGEQWWTEAVPLNIRQGCAQRQEEEHNTFPREAYLNLVDLYTIMDKNWPAFEPHFRSCGNRDKRGSIEWINDLNRRYRRMAGHPLKRHITGFTYTQDDLRQLDTWNELCLRVLAAARLATGNPLTPRQTP